MQPTEKQKLDALIAERDDLLEKKPHLKELQKEVDRLLDACSSQSDRLNVINIMMTESADRLSKKWKKVSCVLENNISNLKKEME